jgi:hypothetical protein
VFAHPGETCTKLRQVYILTSNSDDSNGSSITVSVVLLNVDRLSGDEIRETIARDGSKCLVSFWCQRALKVHHEWSAGRNKKIQSAPFRPPAKQVDPASAKNWAKSYPDTARIAFGSEPWDPVGQRGARESRDWSASGLQYSAMGQLWTIGIVRKARLSDHPASDVASG